MINITVQVTGPGEGIGNEMLIIERALRDAGYPVEVIDEYPPENKEIRKAPAGWRITLKANHLPWGG